MRGPAINVELSSYIFQPSIKFVRKNVTEIVGTMDSNLVMSLFKMIDCFLAPFVPKEVCINETTYYLFVD